MASFGQIFVTVILGLTVVIVTITTTSQGLSTKTEETLEVAEHAQTSVQTVFSNGAPAFHVKLVHNQTSGICTILSEGWVRKFSGFEGSDPDTIHVKQKYALFEIHGRREDVVRSEMNSRCTSIRQQERLSLANMVKEEAPEVRKIVDSGDQANRVDVVFMGDGYTLDEREEFFEDMARLTKDMFEGITFKSYLPLFNIWAIFVPSNESGIGYNGPKQTPFQLYREKGELRVILPGNPEYARTICLLVGDSGCDFPSLIANDDYYGGLGGEFVISTRSNRTGTFVLRHEMGHNFINVGDEYDNSPTYYGVNSADTVESLGWTHWLSGAQREERAIYRVNAYPWYDLSQGSHIINFTSDGTYSRWFLLVSVSAAGENDCLEFELDGDVLPWTTVGHDDREFYSWTGETGLSSGNHTLIVRSLTPSTNPDIARMICSVNLHELGSEDEFQISNDVVSAYPTWAENGEKKYRPTNSGCLMRTVTTNVLCSVCKEGMWSEFFQKVALIDHLTIETGNPDAPRRVVLTTLRLAQFRPPGNEMEGESLEVRWFRNNVEQEGYRDLFEIMVEFGEWRVEVEFKTPEVRRDPKGLLKDFANFVV